MNPKCCICGKECENEWGNNPEPLVKDENARCCDACNQLVIYYRMMNVETIKDPEYTEKILKEFKECNCDIESLLTKYNK